VPVPVKDSLKPAYDTRAMTMRVPISMIMRVAFAVIMIVVMVV
jgi:hypothetical protein